jgi:hypothetical protein
MKMKFQFLFWFLAASLILSCADSPQQNKTVEKNSKNKSLPIQKPASNNHDTLKINSTAAVFYYSDSLQLKKIRSLTDTAAYEANMHEYFFLMRNAHLVIEKNKPQLNIIEAKNVRYLLFIHADKTAECIDLDKKFDPYGLFLFDGKKSPQFVDMDNIDTDLGFYFSK